MRTQTYSWRSKFTSTVILILAVISSSAHAATTSASPTVPPVAGADISNVGTVTHKDKWFAGDAYGDPGSAKGQTFTTGNADVTLKAITYQVTSGQKAAPSKTYVIRVGTVSGSKFTEIHTEEATQDFVWKGGEFMTWTLDAPVKLSANTEYAVDVGMTGSTSSWETGIPYLNCTANSYKKGHRYTSGNNGLGNAKLNVDGNRDRIFHIRLEGPSSKGEAPAVPKPAVKTTAPAAPKPAVKTTAPVQVTGDLLTPFAVTATSSAHASSQAESLINGSGLSENSAKGTHTNKTEPASMWFAGRAKDDTKEAPVVAAQELVFDLGRPYDLAHAVIWNQNQSYENLHKLRGVKTFNILVSPDNKKFTPVGKTVTLAPASGTPADKSQVVPLAASGARFVKFDIQSAQHGRETGHVGLSEVRFVASGGPVATPAPARPTPAPTVASTAPPKPTKPVAPAAPTVPTSIPKTFHTPSTTVPSSLTVLNRSQAHSIDEDELEFRFWRNQKVGKALKAAVLDVDAKSGHMHLYLPDGKNYILPIADYHEEDKIYLLEWIQWKAEIAKREKTQGSSTAAESLPSAPAAIAGALSLRLRTDDERGKVKAEGSKNTYPTKHEFTVQVVTDPAAPSGIPKGQLKLTAYVAHTLNDARMNGADAAAAYDTDSSSVKKVELPAKLIETFTPGLIDSQVFPFTTRSVKGKGSRKDGKKTISYRWEHDQSLLGVRARLIIGGQLAAEAVYPADLDRLLDKQN